MATQPVIEINIGHLRRRLWEVLPGFLSWTTLIGLTILSFKLPYWIAVLVIIYDVYILIRIVYMSIHLLYAYRRLQEHKNIDWIGRCRGVSGRLDKYLQKIETAIKQFPTEQRNSFTYRQLKRHHAHLRQLKASGHKIIPWNQVHHLIVIPTYDESIDVLRTSIKALQQVAYPLERLHVVIGFEERAGQAARQRAATLTQEFASHFGTFLTTFHPDGLPGEKRVKSANATWAIQHLESHLAKEGVTTDQMLVSNLDSDTVVPPEYFSYLTYVFITQPDRYRLSYQPIPVYNNNLWDAPSFSRVIAMGSTFWQMIESTRPERLVTFSSHSMTMRALKDVGYWQKDIISEDSRIFWQALLHYRGHYRTQPLYVTVSMDAALAPSWWQTLKNQYKQKRRWAWGIENFPYLAEGMIGNPHISRTTKFSYLFRTVEGHYSWATSAIIVAGLGWLPVIFGNPSFHSTFLSYSLPFITRTLMTIAMTGLIISATLTLLLMPSRPRDYQPWRYIFLIFQWVLVPLIATVLSAFPALDSETRLMLGRDLQFNVMQKTRKKEPIA